MDEFEPRASRMREVPEHTLSEPDSLLANILAARGVTTDADRSLELANLAPLSKLSGLMDAAALIAKHRNGRVLVVGDFDADGATSTALMLRCLSTFGFAHVDFLVPNRFEFGYGLSAELVAVAEQMQPSLIVTVDNGISSVAGVAAARRAGIDVVVTDHHLPPDVLPDANVIVNPNLVGDPYPSKMLAGVGVAFAVMSAVARVLDNPSLHRVPAQYLDLVALGTVADVVPLDRNNRILVNAGLERINAGHCCAGIAALLSVAGRDTRNVRAADFGFSVAPRLNAAGRLEDMSLGIRCLATDNAAEARLLAEQLHSINLQRRDIESTMQAEALEAIELNDTSAQSCEVLFRRDWHQGVVGLVASRIKDRVHRPVFAFAVESAGQLKGSGRSVPGVHLRDLLAEVDRTSPGIILKFGGHAMAAGLTLEDDAIDDFKAALDRAMDRLYPDFRFDPAFEIDGGLEGDRLSIEFADRLAALGPWGQRFPEPLFEGTFTVDQARVVGSGHLKLNLSRDGRQIDGIAFGQVRDTLPEPGDQVDIVYRLDINEWQGRRRPQLLIEQWHPSMTC
ncbi:MAG: single-stranded-DNA-specific exonuclease RecJ [Pseudomonadota bacterium]